MQSGNSKTDIRNLDDINIMVDAFYAIVKNDDLIGHYFKQTKDFDWDKHLLIMCSFWENVLFSSGNYEGNPLEVHKKIHMQSPTMQKHFTRWLNLFDKTVDNLFEGPIAEMAKQRAVGIANVMLSKI